MADLSQQIIEAVCSAVDDAFEKQGDTLKVQLLSKLNEIKHGQDLTNSRLDQISTMVMSHEATLRGNGKPGLVAIVERIAPQVAEHQDTLRGTKEDIGLVGKVSNLEGKAEGITKPIWIAVSAFIGSAISMAIQQLVR